MLNRNSSLEASWSPDLVGETLINATWLCFIAGGPVGPAGIRSLMPDLAMTGAERLAEGWFFAIPANEEELARQRRRHFSPARVSFLEGAMFWPKEHLGEEAGAARLLQLWLRCKTSRKRFGGELKRRGLARATAYRKRDRALSLISVGLNRDGVRLIEG